VKATKVNAGLAKSNGRLLLGIWRDSLHVTCGLTDACTPGSAPGPTLGNEYGKTLPFLPGAIEGRVGVLGEGADKLGGLGSDVSAPSKVRGRVPAAKRFSCILEAPDTLS